MRRCCIEGFVDWGLRDGPFRIAKEGERFTCPKCGALYQKTDGIFVCITAGPEERDEATQG
jgi:hypothetical protein